MKKIDLIIIYLILFTACVNLPPKDFEDNNLPFLKSKTCIDFKATSMELNIVQEKSQVPDPKDNFTQQIKKGLNFYGLEFNCLNPVKKYEVSIFRKNKYQMLSNIWLVGSVLTFGIIPFVQDIPYEITILDENQKELSKKTIVLKTQVWIFFLPEAVRVEKKSLAEFKTTNLNAVFARAIAHDLKIDLEK